MLNFWKKKRSQKEKFDIISLKAGQLYYPASLQGTGGDLSSLEGLLPEESLSTLEIDIFEDAIIHTEVNLEIGQSRYGGPIMDIPSDLDIPDNLKFAAQLDLHDLSKYDTAGVLPRSGHLFIFADIRTNTGKVIYQNISNEKLSRVVKEHEEDFFMGVAVEGAFSDVEYWSDRYRELADDWEQQNLTHLLNKEGKIFDDFAGTEKSKLFGIFTHCQLGEERIKEIANSEKVLLLQFGENGFNDVGVFSVLIPKDQLLERNFENCEFFWAQSQYDQCMCNIIMRRSKNTANTTS